MTTPSFSPTFSPPLPDNVLRDAGARCDYAAAHAPSTGDAMHVTNHIIRGWHFDDREASPR